MVKIRPTAFTSGRAGLPKRFQRQALTGTAPEPSYCEALRDAFGVIHQGSGAELGLAAPFPGLLVCFINHTL